MLQHNCTYRGRTEQHDDGIYLSCKLVTNDHRIHFSKCRRRLQLILLNGSHLFQHSLLQQDWERHGDQEIKFAWLEPRWDFSLHSHSIINVSSLAPSLWLHSSDSKLRPILVTSWKLVKAHLSWIFWKCIFRTPCKSPKAHPPAFQVVHACKEDNMAPTFIQSFAFFKAFDVLTQTKHRKNCECCPVSLLIVRT